MKFRALKKDGKLDINWERLNVYLSKWKDGTELEIEIVRRKRKVSHPMRKYYWAEVVRTYAEGLGYERNEEDLFHRQLKIVYFRVKPDKKGIYREKDIPSVFSNESQLDVKEKQKFIDWVKRSAARDGVYINDPEGVKL